MDMDKCRINFPKAQELMLEEGEPVEGWSPHAQFMGRMVDANAPEKLFQVKNLPHLVRSGALLVIHHMDVGTDDAGTAFGLFKLNKGDN